MQRGGSTLANYGVSLADSVAMISGANESLQNPEKIGNGLKSIAINFAGMKANATSGNLELNKTAKALKQIAGIDVYTDKSKTQVKDMVTLIEEVKGKWDSLTQTQQLGLSEAIAGKTQSAVFNALMTGWDRVRQFQDEYQKGWMVGSAQRENELYLDSIAGKMNTLKENLKALITGNFSTGIFKDMLEGANKVVLAVDKITSSLGKIGTGGLLFGLMNFIKTMGNLDKFAVTVGKLGGYSMFGSLGQTFKNIKLGFDAGGIKGGLNAVKTAMVGLGNSTTATTMAWGALKAVMAGIAFAGIVYGITQCVKAWDNYVNATKNAVEASKEKQDGIRDELQTLNTQKSGLQEIATEYDKLNSKSKLTYDEAVRLKELKQQIAEIAPDLVSGYDANNDPILKLDGSLSKYMGNLDKAIAKQQELFNYETKQQAREYLKQNDKGASANVDTKRWETLQDTGLEGLQTRLKNTQKEETNFTTNAVKNARKRIEARKKEAEQNQKDMDDIVRLQSQMSEKDSVIQTDYINSFMKKTKIAKDEYKNQFSGFMSSLDWSTLKTDEADQLGNALNKLSEKTAFTKQAMGEFRQETATAFEAFKDTGRLNEYGKTLQDIAERSKQFDLQSWSGYLDEVNARFNSGSMSAEQYNYSLGIMSETMSNMTGISPEIFQTALKGTGDLYSAFETAKTGLNNFLEAYGSSTYKLQQGDSFAKGLEEQFNDLLQFGNDFDLTLDKEGTIECSWLVEQKDNLDLPQQMEKMIDLVTADNKVTEIEQDVIMAVQTEIKDEGKLKDDTVKAIEGLLDGTLNIDKGVEIAGLELNREEAMQLRNSLKEAGIEAKDLKLGDTGMDKAKSDAKELEKSLNAIKNVEIRTTIEQQGFESATQVDNMVKALEKIPKNKKTEFIADTADAFKKTNDYDEAIASLPPEIKLKYNIGVEGDAELEKIQKVYKDLPEEIRTRIGIEDGDYTVDQISMIKEIIDQFGEKTATAFLTIDGAEDALAQCGSVEEFLQTLQQMVVEGKIEITADTEEGEEANSLLEDTDGKEATATVTTELNEKAYNELQTALDKLQKQDGKETKSKHKVESDDKELDKSKEKQDKQDGKKTKSKHKAEADTKELDEAEEKVEKLTTGTHGEVTLTVTGDEKIKATINDKEQLEVDGKAVTYVQVDGGQQYKIAINEKGQLEVNGVAQTEIKVNGDEKLTLTKNEKGELEVNGQAVTTVEVNNEDSLVRLKNDKEEAEKPGEAEVRLKTVGLEDLQNFNEKKKEAGKDEEANVSVTMTLKNTIDNLLAKAGLTKSTANIEINITCQDSATPILSKIEGYNNKSILVNITGQDTVTSKLDTIKGMSNIPINVSISAPNLPSVKSQLDSIANRQIGAKTFTISCPNGSTILSQVNQLANKTIPNKQFYIEANASSALSVVSNLASITIPTKNFSVILNDQATSKMSAIISKNIPNKNFTIDCKDNASSKISAVQAKKISNKTFTVTCRDRASSTLRSIKTYLASIQSKTVSVTVNKTTITKEKKESSSVGSPEVITMNTNVVNTASVDNSNVVSALNSSNEDVVSAMASSKTNINASYTLNAVKYNIDMLTRMTNVLNKIGAQLDTISAKANRAFGTSKSKLLKEEIKLMQKQQSLLNTNYNNMSAMSKKLKSSLKSQGFKFNDDGSISNYTSKLITLQKNLEKAQKAQQNYTGKSEKKQKSLQKAVDKANDKVTKAQNELNQYYDLTFSQMPNAKKEWEDLANSIAEAKAQIIEANHEAKVLYETLQMEVNDFYGGRKATDQSKNEALAEYVDDTNEKIKYLEKANKDIEEQISRQENTIKQAKSRMKDDRAMLEDYGFKFTKNGYIDGGASTLNSLAKKLSPAEYEAVYAIWQEYMKDINKTVPDAEMEIINLNQAIKDNKETVEELIKAEEEEIATRKELLRETKVDELTNAYDRMSTSLDLLEAKQDNAFGKNKLKYMKEQVNVVQALIFQQEKLGMQYKANADELKNELSSKYSIRFDASGTMTNLSDVMSTMTNSEDMEKLKQLADEYNDAVQNWSESEVEIENLNGQMQDLKDSMIELNDEMEEIRRNAMATELDNSFKVLENQLDIINAKMELAGANQTELLKQQIALYKQLSAQTRNSLEYYEELSKDLSGELIEYGFVINDDGTISNTAKQLELLKNSLSETEFDHVNQVLEDYYEVNLDKIPELEKNLIEYQKSEQDVYRDKLETAKDIEEEITKIYEKQVEERIDAIEKERDAKVEALNEAKEAYQKYRDEVEYKNDYNEQLKTVQDLEKQIEIAKRDTSLAGQKRLADLMKQLNDEQKNLEKLVQDKIDEDINDMFDEEIDRTEKEAEQKINNINEVWSEAKIAEAVKEALQTGIFTDIDGNIKALDDALLDFANNSSDYLGVMGATLKTELLDNLGVALETMQEIDKIYKELAVPSELANYTLPDNLSNELANNKGYYNQTVSQNTITIGNTNITITGSVGDATVEELDERLTEFREQLVNEIMKNVY